jgi:hypothetical protein
LCRARKDLVGRRVAAGLGDITQALLAVLASLVRQITVLDKRIAAGFTAHDDAPIFAGMPKAGTLRAARPLAEIGDARGRFPTASSLACLAGAAPSTRQSGRSKVVAFRWGADKNLRDAVCDVAGDSMHANAWANDLYQRSRARGHDHPTPSGSWPGPGSTSSGNAGPTTPPTTRPNTANSNTFSPRQVDTEQLPPIAG